MKRFLLILALCGSAFAQEADPYQDLLDERATLEARCKETSEQVTYHCRRALYYRGVAIEERTWGSWGSPEEDYHDRKAEFFRDLYYSLRAELISVNSKFPINLQKLY